MNGDSIKAGDVVKFSRPMADEDPKQVYRVLSVEDDGTAEIQPIGTGLRFPPIQTVEVTEIEKAIDGGAQ
jgi:hypothetical protein